MQKSNRTLPSLGGSRPKSAMTHKNTNVLTLDEFKQMRNRIQLDGLTEEQEIKLQEVIFLFLHLFIFM